VEKNILKAICVGLVVVIVGAMMVGCRRGNSIQFSFPCVGECVHYDTFDGLDFDYNIVLVAIHIDFRMRNFSIEDFNMINAVEVRLLVPTSFYPISGPIISIRIAEPSRRNIICAMNIVNDLEFVYIAELSFNMPGG